MLKRMNKATSLLIAAAAVVSLVPATGVSAAEKLETKEGTIEQAIAFDGGKYIFDGYKTDDDESGLYYNDGQADKQLDDIDADSMDKYGSKYAQVEDGSDEYLIDLSTGSVQDEDSSDKADSVKTKLKSALTKTDRYGKVDSTSKITLDEITTAQFGETWYSYTTTGASATYSGYVNESGKYVDTDFLANIYVVNAAKTKTVKIEKFGEKDSNSGITVNLVSAKTLAEDSDYIYRRVIVDIVAADSTTTQATYVQKISKVQGDQEDDAYLPKSVTSYEVSTAYDSEDGDDAATIVNDDNAQFRVINGDLYATTNDGSTVTVTTVKLKKDKVTLDGATTKLDVYLAEQDVQEDQDIAGENAVSIDADGNTWALDNGKIYKFDGSDFTQVYTVDTGLDTLDVYNADSLIAWADGDDIYATVDTEATETPVDETPAPVVTAGWVKNTDGTWSFNKADGTKSTGWVQDGAWYYLNANGIMQTGWVNDNGTWYYLTGSGAMATGWVNDNGTWYYLAGSGAMKTGWLNDNGTWYYLSGSGAMLANTTVDGYKLNASGAWVK